MLKHNVSLGRILGIKIGLDYSWFVIFALLTLSLGGSYFPAEFKGWAEGVYWVVGGASALMLFVCVLLHELGHAVVARKFGVPVRSITLFLFGGVAQIGAEPPSAWAEFLIAIAGPCVSFLLAIIFMALRPLTAGLDPLLALLKYLAFINLALVVFNLIPGYPLDGGRIFRSIVWAITGKVRRATLIAAHTGRIFAFLFIFYGFWQLFLGNIGGGLWIAFIGWFLDNAASAQLQQVTLQDLLTGYRVGQAMSTDCPAVSGELTLQELVSEHILGSGKRSFFVHDGGHPIGLMTLRKIKEVPRAEWAKTRAAQVMLPFEKLKCLSPDSELWSAFQEMVRDGIAQLPVIRDNQAVGILNRDDIVVFLQTLKELRA
jgi:Zn-dependent protease/CBS domain-containing protein